MAGIAHLTDIYRKKGKDFVDKLFDNYVTINEKLDGSAFSFEKSAGNELFYYKRNNSNPISMVDRTLAKYYEKPINYFDNLPEKIKNKIPVNWRFGFEYFVSDDAQELLYDQLPKNGLVLSYIHVKNNAGKVVRVIQEKSDLDKWADILGVERSPILFQGVLNNEQKIQLLEFLDTAKDNLSNKFKTTSFTKYMISILNPKLKKTLLNEDLDKPIEGLVIRFGSDDNNTVLAKMIDPVFMELSKLKVAENVGEGNDIYHITLMALTNFIETLNFNKYKPTGRTYEDRYLNFICAVFNAFVDEQGADYEDVDFNEPAYLKKREFDLNSEFITNKETLSNIDRSEGLKKLFKIMLASFRKKKRKANGIFSDDVKKQFNLTIDKINSHLLQNLKESDIPLFGDFLTVRGREPELDDEYTSVDSDEDDEEEFIDIKPLVDLSVDDLKDTLSGEIISPEIDPPKKNKKINKVNLVVGRFQPFHNGHLEMIRELYEANKLPTVIVAVHPGHNKSGNSPLTIPTMRTLLDNVKKEEHEMICDYRIIGRGFIHDVMDSLRPIYEPVLWGAGLDRYDDYQKQLELNFVRKNELDLDEKFMMMETKRHMKGEDVRTAIKDDNFGSFKSMVPASVQSIYPLLRNDILKDCDCG